MPLMRRCRLAKNTALSCEHVWLYAQEVNIAFDPLILIRDTRTELVGLAFIGEKRPMLNPSEGEVAQLERKGLTLLDPQATSGSEEMMCQNDRSTISKIVKALALVTEGDIPSADNYDVFATRFHAALLRHSRIDRHMAMMRGLIRGGALAPLPFR